MSLAIANSTISICVNAKARKERLSRWLAGCSPFCEGVLLIKADTTLSNLSRFCIECKQRWRITPILVFMLKDEGRWLYGEPDADEKESLSNSEYRKLAREVDDIAIGRYEQQRRGKSIKL